MARDIDDIIIYINQRYQLKNIFAFVIKDTNAPYIPSGHLNNKYRRNSVSRTIWVAHVLRITNLHNVEL